MTTPPLQPGQYWRTRAGDIRYVAAVLPEWSGVQMPVIVLHNGGSGDIFIDQYTRQGGFLIYNRESDHDLITHLPECDSLDWAPATIEYPAYVMPASGDFHYAYIRRDSATSAEVVYRSGHVEPYSWTWESQGFIDKGSMIYITKEQAESRVKRPAPVEYPQWRVRDDKYGYLFRASEDTPWVRFNKHGASVPDRECLHIEAWRITTQEDAESRIQEQAPVEYPKYYHGSGLDSGYFRRDSKTLFVWVNESGEESVQGGAADMLLDSGAFTEITKEEAETRVKKSDHPETVVEIDDSVLSLMSTPTALMVNGEIAGLITGIEFGLMNDEIRKKTPVARQYLGVSVSPPEVLSPPHESPVAVPEKQAFHHTAPEVWSMIEKSRRANHLGNNRTAVGNLIRICSAQQSMLSELSAQVDALRSKQS